MQTTLPPAKWLGFLVHDVGRLLRRQIDQRAQALGLTSAQWRVLSAVARTELLNQEPLNQASLADQLEIEPITLSRSLFTNPLIPSALATLSEITETLAPVSTIKLSGVSTPCN